MHELKFDVDISFHQYMCQFHQQRHFCFWSWTMHWAWLRYQSQKLPTQKLPPIPKLHVDTRFQKKKKKLLEGVGKIQNYIILLLKTINLGYKDTREEKI